METKSKNIWKKVKSMIQKQDGKIVFKGEEKKFFDIFSKSTQENCIKYTINEIDAEIMIQLPQSAMTVEEVLEMKGKKVDSTGIKLWPAEEVLGYYILQNLEKFKNKKVIELGAGYSGLASLILAFAAIKHDFSIDIEITDGLEICVERIIDNINKNNAIIQYFDIYKGDEIISRAINSPARGKIKISLLIWSKTLESETSYDYLIASDCLFFKNFHEDLVHTIKTMLGDDEKHKCILANPSRGNSMEIFFGIAEPKLSIEKLGRGDFLDKLFEDSKSREDYREDQDNIFLFELSCKM